LIQGQTLYYACAESFESRVVGVDVFLESENVVTGNFLTGDTPGRAPLTAGGDRRIGVNGY
jgi:hypothetical protein